MTPSITDAIIRIQNNKSDLGITLYDKASMADIVSFEKVKGIRLPDDLRTFYSFCNGFESAEDMFRIIPLDEIIENGHDSYIVGQEDFHFAEYMIYSDMWTFTFNNQDNNKYSIYNKADNLITLTNSFSEFLDRFLNAGVFDGLYTWREEIERAKK